jgi:hypothetical protein
VSERHLSPADLDLLLIAGETEPDTAGAAAHLRACPRCQDRRAQRDARDAEFRRVRLPALLARQPPPPGRRFALRATLGGLALAPVAIAAALLIVRPGRRAPDSQRPITGVTPGVKGTPGFRLIARRGEAVFEVLPDMKLRAGDALRFVLEPAGHPYLLIAAIDSAGKASVYHPFGGASSARVLPDEREEAPAGSVVLDTAPGPERVFALWSTEPLLAATVLARLEEIGRRGPDAIRDTTRLEIPGTIQTSQLLEKEETP